ncbi:glycine zipper domain-containing protein [Acidithiobacillus acidisediminis]|jgi:osmotically inducible lipoprotein OsmB|uniref:glycine zipper domain-containing protein n=1 Tax=Acidithiobacillus acidisediminis TaxID=2937799 RepID=UPI00200EF84A|nr:glycine zipper domain-containing protein [Acidithiobacillus sp. S30A2]
MSNYTQKHDKSALRVAIGVITIAFLSGCANMSPTGQRALSGGAIGAAGGAVLGTVVAGNPAVGAAVGGAVGAGVGAALPQIENGLNGN